VVHRVTAVDELTLTVPEGEIFGFLGPNGAGKTTTIQIICGLLLPDDGQVVIDGDTLDGFTPQMRQRLGYLPEQVGLYGSLTARQTLAFFGGFYDLPRDELTERGEALLGLLGLKAQADRRVATFSLGMRKRLALATALLHRPRLLVLDEPTSGLDPRGVAALRQMLRQLCDEGLTIFLSSHVLGEVQQLCTSVAILDRGKLVAHDTIAGLRRTVHAAGVRLELQLVGCEPEHVAQVEALDGVTSASATTHGHRTALEVVATEEAVPQVTSTLVAAGVQVFSVAPREPTLEEVFLARTSEESDDDDNDDEDRPSGSNASLDDTGGTAGDAMDEPAGDATDESAGDATDESAGDAADEPAGDAEEPPRHTPEAREGDDG